MASLATIIQDMVYRAVTLKSEIASMGVRGIESYPYASKVAPFGKPMPSKLKLLASPC